MTKAGMIYSGLAIVALVGAVAVAVEYGGLTAPFTSIATAPSVDRAQTPVSSTAPLQQPEVEQPGAIAPVPTQPVPAPPAPQLAAPAPPAPVANDPTSAAKTAPVLDETGSGPAAQANSRVTAAEILVPDSESGASRAALTAEEKEAVARGRRELGITAAGATPPSQSEQAETAELNRKALADIAAEQARSKQLQAQSRQ